MYMKKKVLWGIIGVVVLGGLGACALAGSNGGKAMEYETTTMSGTTVRTLVSVVGSVKAEKDTKLAFAKSGTVESVTSKEGQRVSSGTILAILKKDDLLYEVDRVRSALSIERNTLDKLRSGLSSNERAVLDTNIQNAQIAITALRTSLNATRDRTAKEVDEARLVYEGAKGLYETSISSIQEVNNADIRSLEVSLSSAKASLEATRATNTQSIQSAQTALDSAKKDLEANAPIQNKNLEDAQERTFYDASKYLNEGDKTLRVINDIITIEEYNKDQNLPYRNLLGVRLINSYTNTLLAYNDLKLVYDPSRNLFDITNNTLTYTEILRRLDKLRDILNTSYSALSTTLLMLDNSMTSVELTQGKLNTFKDSVLNQRIAVSSALSGLATVRQSVENLELQKTSADTSQQNKVASAQQALVAAQAQAAASELQAKNTVSQAEENLRKAQAGVGAKDIDLQRLKNSADEASKRLTSAEARYNEQLATSSKSISDLESQLRAAEAQKLSQASPARWEDIRIQQNRVNQAETALKVAEDNLENAYIRAPKEGIISKVSIKEGEQASPANPVVSMISDDFSVIEANIAENEIAQVHPGQKVTLTFDAFDPDSEYTGVVTFIDPAQTALDGVIYYRTEISFNPKEYSENVVRPGFSANLDIITKEQFSQAVPVQAVKDAGEKGKKVDVLIEEGDKKRTEERFVELGLVGDDYIEILSGLKPEEKVVLSVADPSKK